MVLSRVDLILIVGRSLRVEKSYGGRRVVFPSGSLSAPIYIVGSHPENEETRRGINMVGMDGQALFRALERAGIKREDCRISNLVWVQPPIKNKPFSISSYGLSPGYFHDELLKDIKKVNPEVILAVGGEALSFLTGKSRILKWRGSPLPFLYDEKITVIPTLFYSYITKGNFPFLLALRSDCRKVFKVWRGLYTPKKRDFMSFSRGFSFLDFKFELKRLSELKGFLSYDIEGWYPRMSCISFSSTPLKAVSVPLVEVFGEEKELVLFSLIREVLENKKSYKIAHNMLFDNNVLAKYGIGVRNIFMDTMLAHHAVFTDLPHSLAFLTSIYTWESYYKDDRAMLEFIGSQVEADDYSCKDSVVTLELVNPLMRELEEYGLVEFYFKNILSNIKSAGEMQSFGLVKDEKKRLELRSKAFSKLEKLEGELPFNPQSTKQVGDYVYKTLGLSKIMRRRKIKAGFTKTQTTDEEAIVALVQKYPLHKGVLLKVLEARKSQHDVSHYLDAGEENGRYYYSINLSGTSSGRLAVSKVIDKSGWAAHGVPLHIRSVIVPPFKDCVLWKCDSKQAESMFVAWVAGEDILYKAFMEGRDTHQIIGGILFDCEPEEVVGLKRDVAKTIRHGTNYWMGPGVLQKRVNFKFPSYSFSFRDAKRLIGVLREVNPKTFLWGKGIENAIYIGIRIFRTCWGRQRMLLGPSGPELVKSAISFKPQSSIADLIHISTFEIMRGFKEERFDSQKNYIHLTRHDEIFGVCERSLVEKVKRIVTSRMEQEFPDVEFKGTLLKIPSEFSIGENWGEMEVLE